MDVKEVKPINFKVTDKDGNLVFVSKVELNEAKTVATLSFFDKFVDKGVYTVETSNVEDVDGNVMEKDTKAFAYQAAEVSKVEFTQTTVGQNVDLVDLVKVTDALGRDVTKEVVIEYESSNAASVDASTKKTTTTDGSAIVVAKVKVGTSYVKSAPTTITVKDAAADKFAGYYAYTGIAATDTDAFAKLEADKKIDYVYMNATTPMKLGLYYKDQYGKTLPVADDTNVTITNLTPNIVIVEKATGDNTLDIKPISAGEGFVKVKNGDVETTVKITVRAKAKVTTMAAEKTDISVGTDSSVNSQTVKVKYTDQFNADATPAGSTLKAKVADETIALVTPALDGETVTVTGLKKGSTTVELSYKVDADTTLKQTLNITVTEAGTLAGYKVENKSTKLDLNTANTADPKTPIESVVKVFSTDANGNKIEEINLDGTTNKLVVVDKDGVADSTTGTVTIASNNKVVAGKAGTGYVQVKVGSLVVETLEFEVVNTLATAKIVVFNENAIVKQVDEIGTLSSGISIDTALLTNIVTVKDQYGKDKTGDILDFTFNLTNKADLTITETTANKDYTITTLDEATGTVDIVITKVVVSGQTEDLISAPVVVKLSVKADEALAIEAINTGLANDKNYVAAGFVDVDVTDVDSGGEGINDKVAAAKVANNNDDLTKAEIQEVITDFYNLLDVEADKALIEAGSYEIPTANQTDQATKTAWVQDAVDALIANDTTATVTYDSSGTKYDVALEKGNVTDSATIIVTEE